MKNKSPKVSIILPTYNGEKFLSQSIDSIINQTMKDWELIIVNDCSTDHTLKIANDYAKKDSRIKVINNETNKKLPASLNIGFEVAVGKYFTWTSDDNMFKKNAIEVMSNYLDVHQNIDLVCMNEDIIDEDENFLIELDKFCKYKRSVASLLYECNTSAAFMYTKKIAEKVGKYDTDMFCAEDYDYFCRIALNGNVAYTNDNIYLYRMNSSSLTATKSKQVQEKTFNIKRKYAAKFFKKCKYNLIDRALFYDTIKTDIAGYEYERYKYTIIRSVFACLKFFINMFSMIVFWNKKLRHRIRKFFLKNTIYAFAVTPN